MILNFILKDKTIIPYEKITFKKRGKYYNNVRVSNIDKVECKCDICNKIYYNVNEFRHKKKPYCSTCSIKKTSLDKYGVENYNQSKGKIKKCKQTNIQNYGVETNFFFLFRRRTF